MKFLVCLLFTTLIPLASYASENLKPIIDHVDKLYRSQTSKSEVEMQIVNPNWERTLRMNIWTETMKNTFIDILYPNKEKGSGTLRISNEMWNYFPKVGKVVKVPPSMMMSSWMGSDFNNDDLVKETTLVDDYSSKEVTGTDKNNYYIELTPKKNTVTVWGKIILTVKKDNKMPITEEYFDEKGAKIRTLTFSDYKTMGGRLIPATLELVPTGKTNQKTIIKYINASFDTTLPSDTFSLINLQRKR
jgi:outer membrane lipoprotein-sorting protein